MNTKLVLNNRKCIITRTERGITVSNRNYDIDFCGFKVPKTKEINETDGDISINFTCYDIADIPYYIETKRDGHPSDFDYLIQNITPKFFKKKITAMDLAKLHLYEDRYLYVDLNGTHAFYELAEGDKPNLVNIFDIGDKKFVNFKMIREYVRKINRRVM
jgi:hypothetical protein